MRIHTVDCCNHGTIREALALRAFMFVEPFTLARKLSASSGVSMTVREQQPPLGKGIIYGQFQGIVATHQNVDRRTGKDTHQEEYSFP
jgi:hypothetical protein